MEEREQQSIDAKLAHAPDIQVLTLEEAAAMLRVKSTNPRESIRRLIRIGKLKSLRNGRQKVTTVGCVREYIASCLLPGNTP